MHRRVQVEAFADAMETILARHDAVKGGSAVWRTMDLGVLFHLLLGEVAELQAALKDANSSDIAQEAVDVANYAMMICDNTWAANGIAEASCG